MDSATPMTSQALSALDQAKPDIDTTFYRRSVASVPMDRGSKVKIVCFDRNLHSRMPSEHACDQRHYSLGRPLFLPVHTVNCIQTLQVNTGVSGLQTGWNVYYTSESVSSLFRCRQQFMGVRLRARVFVCLCV